MGPRAVSLLLRPSEGRTAKEILGVVPIGTIENAGGPHARLLLSFLHISPNADLDTIHRVYRLLAQRLHPDNQATGDSERFRALTEAYQVVGDPERRAQYDVHRPERQQERSRLISEALRAQNDVESEQLPPIDPAGTSIRAATQ